MADQLLKYLGRLCRPLRTVSLPTIASLLNQNGTALSSYLTSSDNSSRPLGLVPDSQRTITLRSNGLIRGRGGRIRRSKNNIEVFLYVPLRSPKFCHSLFFSSLPSSVLIPTQPCPVDYHRANRECSRVKPTKWEILRILWS